MAKKDAGSGNGSAGAHPTVSAPSTSTRSLPTAQGASPSHPGFIRRLRQN